MSRENVMKMIAQIEAGEISITELPDKASAADIVKFGKAIGIDFSTDDLGAFLRLRIASAESLPRPWGWPIARELGLVRS
ncbi:MAG: hypothetical protein CBB68_07805 [Rhodospirillaceae bacterium TMED8]|nr:hypothetical protein [Magnetovibrio sp.]OUT50883.1 MAG: hypothetical protein CBB68_07805 [Rhodospirillaceae bacterium TMED8]